MSGQKLEKKIAETQYWSWNPEVDGAWNPEADGPWKPEADGPSGYSSGIATLVVYIDL